MKEYLKNLGIGCLVITVLVGSVYLCHIFPVLGRAVKTGVFLLIIAPIVGWVCRQLFTNW